ncbi:hypothetical protein RB653_003130 [Dictyostelium firmibasis]|uniref:Uncharacterized protein n=1 Tax=Dictyostelium firmibasis TaxID=79012 RepID=A0AAN7TQ06_9MYCE
MIIIIAMPTAGTAITTGSIKQVLIQCGKLSPMKIESVCWLTIDVDIKVSLPSDITLFINLP